ncbi:CRTAC1 family protein [Algibacillus agarilyticus]|uniref:CRTAC1 family protein n=1 Tax=Algibacillus agarilyticus TaxID=2234133 RepID=UPI000DD0192E|nr:CRTAC1 family protein [Algibacillus agarilyticus]
MFRKKLFPVLCVAISGVLASCASQELSLFNNSASSVTQTSAVLASPFVLTNSTNLSLPYLVKGSTLKRLTLDLSIDKSYANISVYAGDKLVVDNLNVPTKGQHKINVLIDFEAIGDTTLRFVRRSADITLNAIQFEDITDVTLPRFANRSKEANFETEISYKYGGPSIGDVDNDGDYDFVLNNHNHVPTQLVTQNDDHTLDIERLFGWSLDFHGSSVGDYDADGDLDIMVAQGGANGTNPTSYILLRNDNQKFVKVSAEAGILTPARGRSPRWVDFDLDGDLDLALFNAKTPNYDGPRQLFYKNNGDSTFTAQRVEGAEYADGERVLVTDFNNDGIDDLVAFSPVSLWQGNGDFTFTDVTKARLPASLIGKVGFNAVTDVDVNNDGLLDIYLAGGRTHYLLSRKSIDFNPQTKRLDIRDDGEKGATAVTFDADGAVKLSEMELTYRQYNDGFAIFLGKDKTRKIVKAKGFQPNQLPEEMKTAPIEMDITPAQAQGWPTERNVNGLYIGHIGNGQWQAEWVRDRNIYWTVTFSLTGLNNVDYDWQPNNRNIQDILLVNKGDHFIDGTKEWNLPLGGNNWGVTHADFNNDGWEDLFVYRYGFLKQRIADLLLLNTGEGRFDIVSSHGAFEPTDPGHGDMGQAFDFDNDGRIDMLNGSEEEGPWLLYKNQNTDLGNYALFDVGYSPKANIDPYSAVVSIKTTSGKEYQKRVGSAGEVHSQSLLDIVHFGLGDDSQIESAQIRWRNGEVVKFGALKANALYKSENAKAQ